MANENVFDSEIKEEDSDDGLVRQHISSFLDIPRCMSKIYYLLDTVSINNFKFNLLFCQIIIIYILELVMENERLFDSEIKEEDSDDGLDRQHISSFLDIPRCMSKIYYLLDTISINNFKFNLLFCQIIIIYILEFISNYLYVRNATR
jgi:hypothetical protein